MLSCLRVRRTSSVPTALEGSTGHMRRSEVDLAEPSCSKGVNLFTATTEFEAEYYSREESSLDTSGKSDVEYQQIMKRYAFVG